MTQMNEEMIEELKKTAKRSCYYDDENEGKIVDDYVGGNVDDAFSLGESAGEVMMARSVLTSLNIKWY